MITRKYVCWYEQRLQRWCQRPCVERLTVMQVARYDRNRERNQYKPDNDEREGAIAWLREKDECESAPKSDACSKKRCVELNVWQRHFCTRTGSSSTTLAGFDEIVRGVDPRRKLAKATHIPAFPEKSSLSDTSFALGHLGCVSRRSELVCVRG